LIQTLRKILGKLWDEDTHVQIIPWYGNSSLRPMRSINNIPSSLANLKQYFFPRMAVPQSKRRKAIL
jgi:hypothetical protein